jgi:outer membrane protein assembly factor BamB
MLTRTPDFVRVVRWLPWLAALACVAAPGSGESDGWPRYAHDPALTARSPLHGNIARPQTRWSYSVAGRELLVEILPTKGEHPLRFVAKDAATVSREPKVPKLGSIALDLDGSGTLRPALESYHERWAKILPNVKGLQRVAWSHTWTDQKVCRLQLFAYDQGFDKPRVVWQTDPPEDTIFQPLNIVYDLDGDGVPEVCVAAHYRVMIFEGTTGRKETELRYHQSRAYGWFGLADVDGDGQKELITLGDFQSHIDVLNYEPKKPEGQRLSVRWRRDVEQNIEERKKWPQIGPRPVVDVTGDARLEIVLNLFNDSGDGQWHVVVLSAATGEQLFDLPRQFVQGTADVEADGKAELFVIGTDGVLVPAFGTIQLVDLRGGAPSVKWSQTNSAWVCADLPGMDATWSTSASQGMRQVLLSEGGRGERPAFLVAQRKADAEAPFPTTLTAVHAGKDGKLETMWQVSGLPGDLQFLALAPVAGGLGASLRLRVAQDTELSLVGVGAEARVVENRPLGVTLSTPIAARLRPNGPMTVLVEGAAEQIVALQPPAPGILQGAQGGAPRVVWRRPGRGMGDGSRWLGPLAADLDGDGGNEVVVAGQDSSGRALLIAYCHDGSRLWQTRFDQTPGALPVWNVGALTFWWPGSFRAKGRIDLFVQTRRGLMHSDIGQLLDGRTGAIVWRQEKAIVRDQFAWGYAGIPPGVANLEGDGLDELISLYPVCFWVADGRTGRLIHGVELASRKKLPAWAAYGEPMIHRFTGKGTPEVLLDSPYILALLETNGTPMWHGLGRADYLPNEGNAGQTTSIKHALVDFAGDGTFQIASAGYGDGVRAIDPRDGKVLWSLTAPVPTCSRVVAVDIDGRKGDELLYVAGSQLIAITGDRSAGRILWEWQGPADLSLPAIADLDGGGLAQIIVQAADGTVHCVGSRP